MRVRLVRSSWMPTSHNLPAPSTRSQMAIPAARSRRQKIALGERVRGMQLFVVIFVAIVVIHGPLLHLPFFWDEAGFYVPAAYDLIHFHSLIPHTTLDTGHPPLPAAYLALW